MEKKQKSKIVKTVSQKGENISGSAKPAYSYNEVVEFIKNDREVVIQHIKEMFVYDMRDFFDDVPIRLT